MAGMTAVERPGLAPGETAWRLPGGETIIVRISAAQHEHDPAWVFLVVEARVIDPATGGPVLTLQRFVHSVQAASLESGESLESHLARQQEAAGERAANALAARRALDRLPRAVLE